MKKLFGSGINFYGGPGESAHKLFIKIPGQIKSHSGGDTSFYAHPSFQGHAWYDWALVNFEEQNGSGDTIETTILQIKVNSKKEAMVQCSKRPLDWNTVESKFFVAIKIGTDYDISFVSVPMDALVHPLCVLPDIGGNANTYYVVLPKRNWSRYFGDKIKYNQT